MRTVVGIMLAAVGALAVWLGGASAAGAGGWAVTSVDDVPTTIEPGTPVDVELTVLQHGRTPVDGEDVAIVVGPVDGQELRFAAEPTGEPGRYRAQITIDAAGSWPWRVEQGIFGIQPLGELEVGEPAMAGSTGTGGGLAVPLALRLALTATAAVSVVAAVAVWRRRPVDEPAAA